MIKRKIGTEQTDRESSLKKAYFTVESVFRLPFFMNLSLSFQFFKSKYFQFEEVLLIELKTELIKLDRTLQTPELNWTSLSAKNKQSLLFAGFVWRARVEEEEGGKGHPQYKSLVYYKLRGLFFKI